MEDETLKKMMDYMQEGKKQSLYLSTFLCTITLLISIGFIFMVDYFIIKTNSLIVFRVCSIFLILLFVFLMVRYWSFYRYGDRKRNQDPWRFGIYEAYYECSKCESLAGGIFGKGPTQRSILDEKCVHDWQAVYRDEFERKFTKQKNKL